MIKLTGRLTTSIHAATLVFLCVVAPGAGAQNLAVESGMQPAVEAEQIELLEPAPDTTDDDVLTKEAAQAHLEAARELISAMETQLGVYDFALSQAYADLGNTLQILDQHDDALEAYGKGLQAARINNGLFDPMQLPIIRAALDSYVAVKDWEAVDNHLHLFNNIARHVFEPDDDRRVKAISDLGRWKLYADSRQLMYDSIAMDSLTMLQQEIDFLQNVEEYERKGLHLALLELDYASTNFYMAQKILDQPIRDFQQTGQSSTTTQVQCSYIRQADGTTIQVCTTVEVPNMDYYLIPAGAKNMEIRHHMSEMKASILNAWRNLENFDQEDEDKMELIAEIERLTAIYNQFMADNEPKTGTRIQ